jgi:hypothetical protein
VSSPKEVCWDPSIYYSKQRKKNKKQKKKLQEQHIACEAIKI